MSEVRIVTVRKQDAGIRLDRWFKLYVPEMSHIALQKALRKGQVRLDGKKVTAGDRIEAGQAIRVPPLNLTHSEPLKTRVVEPKAPSKEALAKLKACVIFENDTLAVINKPQGLAVQGGTGQAQNVDAMLPFLFKDCEDKPRLVHRIDKDTSGLLVVAKTRKAAAELTESFREKTMHKRYLAVVVGVPVPREGVINLPLAKGVGGKGVEKMQVDRERGLKSISRYRVLDYAHEKAALVELEPVTGRTHQLRVHMAEIGHPILGDGKYGGKVAFLETAGNTLHLHAWQLELPKQMVQKKQPFTAEIPPHMKGTVEFLGLLVD